MDFLSDSGMYYKTGWGVGIEFKLQDFWIGVFWKNEYELINVWICLIPCFPIHYWSGTKKP